MPDWRNPADYEYTAGLTLHQWAWEFLRRNPEYQIAYRAWQIGCRLTDRRHPFLQTTVDFPSDESMAYARLRCDLEGLRFLNAAASRPYGLNSPVNPTLPSTHRGTIGIWAAAVGVSEVWLAHQPSESRPDVVALIFDLTLPIAPQIELAKGHLERRQARLGHAGVVEVKSKTTRAQLRLYPTYLRVLDGRLSGAGSRRIGTVVFKSLPTAKRRSRALSAIKAGIALMSGGYRDLLLMSPLPEGWE